MTPAHSTDLFFETTTIAVAAGALAGGACARLWMTGWQSGSATFYGVRVDPDFEYGHEAAEIDAAYCKQVLWFSTFLFAVMVAIVLLFPQARTPRVHSSIYVLAGLVLAHNLGMQALYWRARQQVLPFAAPVETVRTADLASFVTLSLQWKVVYWCAVLLPLGVTAAAALYLRAHFGLIAPPFTVASILRYVPQAPVWTRAMVYAVYKPLVQVALLNITAVLVAYAFNYRSRISEWGAEVNARWTYRKLLMSRLAIVQWVSTVGLVFLAMHPLVGTPALPISQGRYRDLSTALPLIMSIVSLVLLVKLYRSRPVGAVDTASDRSWKFGQYYFNPQDPALIVPTRFGVGHTLNLGKPLAWAFPVLTALAIVSPLAGPIYIPAPQLTQSRFAAPPRVSTDQLLLNSAVVRLRQGDGSAAQTIEGLAERHHADPEFLNNAAYQLALADKELPSARSYAQQAVSLKEQQLQNLELGDLNRFHVNLLREMAMFWDTLGWVCYQQHDLNCAHRYLLAAWTINGAALFGSHLAQIEEKQGRSAAAIGHYREAFAESGSPAEKLTIGSRLDVLTGGEAWTGRERGSIPLNHVVRRSDVFDLDLLIRNAGEAAKHELPAAGNESHVTGPVLSQPEKNAIAAALPQFPFPDAGPERIMIKVRVTCLKRHAACSMLPYTPYPPGTLTY